MKLRNRLLFLLAVVLPVSLAMQSDDDAKGLPAGAGKDVVVKVCIDCHGAASFRKMRFTEDEWWEKVGDMVDRGAKADDKQQAAIVGYLVKNFGKNAPVLVNSAPHSEFIVVLGFSPNEAQAIVSYRSDYGAFKDWHDLLKVPGIDAAKVEAKKDKMSF